MGDVDALRALVARLAEALCEGRAEVPAAGGEPADAPAAADGEQQTLETHISVVLLHGSHALKFKKPLDLGFADFSTLARRRLLCEQEIRLNRRFAPGIYRQVVAVTGSRERPVLAPLEGDGCAALEYAVQMRRFPGEAMLDHLVAQGAVSTAEIEALVDDVAAFHARAEQVGAGSRAGSAALVHEQVLASLEQGPAAAAELKGLLREHLDRLRPVFSARQRDGFVRDCHGDLHLSNVVRFDGRLTPFDCIEFNEELRLTDTVADFAFLLMDLDYRGERELANAAFNRYFERSGDYAGLAVLPLYLAYRSLVRAKVANLQAAGEHGAEADARRRRAARHVALARAYLAPPERPALWIAHGLSGSGKSWASRRLALRTGWLHLRSDIERRRVLGLARDESTDSRVGEGAYSERASEATYAALAAAARAAIDSGFGVIVDAAFLDAGRRHDFATLAAQLGVTFRILDCGAPEAVLRQRIRARAARGGDPSEADEAVLEHQLRTRVPLAPAERAAAVDAQAVVDAKVPLPAADPLRPGVAFTGDDG